MKPLFAVFLFMLAAVVPSACASTAVTVVGKTVTISYTVGTGTPPFTQQWFKDGTAIPGATNATFVISSIAAGDAGSYTVQVSNQAGSAMSDTAVISLVIAPGGIVTGIQVTLRGVTTFYPLS